MPSSIATGRIDITFVTNKVERYYDYVILHNGGEEWYAYPSGSTLGNRTLNWVKQPTRSEVDALNSKIDSARLLRIIKTLPTITIGPNGYTSIEKYYPGAQTGYQYLTCAISHFGTVSTKDAVNITTNTKFLMGTANATITNLQIAYIYGVGVTQEIISN